jgi:TonB family protein
LRTLERNKLKLKNPFRIAWNGVPATARRYSVEDSLYGSVAFSIFWHIIGALIISAIAFALVFFGIAPKLFSKPESKIKDIEFVLHDHHAPQIHHKKVELKQDFAFKPPVAPAQPEPAPAKLFSHKTPSNNVGQKAAEGRNSQGKTNKVKGTTASHSKSASSDFSMPMPSLGSMSSGIGGSGHSKRHAAGVSTSTSSIGGIGGDSSASSASNGNGFDKNATKKIISTYDISPYVNELKRQIRWNWKAPKDGTSKRVELFIRIAKDGRIMILNVKHTSEVGNVDEAALSAVRKCAPLNPLPSKYAKSYLDIVFTFSAGSVGSRY